MFGGGVVIFIFGEGRGWLYRGYFNLGFWILGLLYVWGECFLG